MKYAVIADIHANLEALEAVLKDAKEQECSNYCCLGDVVGYYANPKECLEIIRGLGIPCVKGNHDEYCSSDEPLSAFVSRAVAAVQWTRDQLDEEDKRWLRGLDYIREVEKFTIVHSTLDRPRKWGYVFDHHMAAASFAYQQTSVCFFGHTHLPMAFIREPRVRGGTYSQLKLEQSQSYFINPGSVGQPRDRDARASYLIYDLSENLIELRRVAYDTGKARQKAIDQGLGPR